MDRADFRAAGWVWEGQGFDPGVQPSVFGVGQGADYFGISKCNLMFHPNDAMALDLLADKEAVVCDISKWKFIEIPRQEGQPGGVAFKNWRDSNPDTVIAEAEHVSAMAMQYPNIVGAMIDDASGVFHYDNYDQSVPGRVRDALDSARQGLNLWLVVYVQQIDDEAWLPWVDAIDTVHLWCGHPHKLPELPAYVDQCIAAFPDKEIIVGSYLRDYSRQAEVPTAMVQAQYEAMLALWQEEKIAGYSILANCLIDRHPEQAEWIRDFLSDE
jgi:hypothetical protein